MNGNDLLKGLQHLDEELVQEAANYKKTRKPVLPVAAAAAAVFAVILGGTVIFRQQQQIGSLEKELNLQISQNKEAAESTETVGVVSGSRIGSLYTAAESYDDLYQLILNQFGDVNYVSGGFVEETKAGSPREDGVAEVTEEAAPADDASGTSAAENSSDSDYSSTNIMTENVDESDIVKTDGDYIYVVHSGTIEITDIRDGIPGQSVRVTPEFTSPSDEISEIFVDHGYLTILGNHYEMNDSLDFGEYGYSGGKDQTFIYVYDIEDPLHPQFVGSMIQDGSFNTARKIGDQVYLFTDYYLERMPYSEKEAFKAENLKNWVPTINGKPVASDCIYLPDHGYHGLVISSFQVSNPKEILDAKVIVDDYSEIYVSNTSIYLYSATYQASRQLTEIAKLEFDDGLISADGVTSVGGEILDQFAINEKNGYLRVLATNWEKEENTLYVLDSDLKQTGRIDGIARGERIYAARFIGDMGYFITYRNMDPLFAVDLSDPAHPEILGELEISGFSDYLHVWDENHLLGIGYETDGGVTQGMKYVMFDISDPADLMVENSYVIHDIDFSSALSGNYKAILVSPGKNLIGVAGNDYDDENGTYYVMQYDKEKGFRKALVEKLESWDTSQYRGLYSGDYFYLVGYGDIRAYRISDGFEECGR